MTLKDECYSIKERCICCTGKRQAASMKFIAKTGHWVCIDCFSGVESGLPMVQAQLGYRWSKEE